MDDPQYREVHRRVTNYLSSLVSREFEMFDEGDVEEACNEVAMAAVDVLWLAEGKDLPDEYYDPGFRHRQMRDEPRTVGRHGFRLIQGGCA